MNLPISGDSAYFLELYARYRKDRHSVPPDWIVHFENLDGPADGACGASGVAERLSEAYRRFGHLEAQLDPLAGNPVRVPLLERLRASTASLADEAVDIVVAGHARRMRLGDADALLRSIYGASAALEADHLVSEEERGWWHAAFEQSFLTAHEDGMLLNALESVTLADEFESFMRVKFPTRKRFGLEGAESAIVFLRDVVREAAQNGTRSIVMGGMHRGRLATLATALGKSVATLVAEIMGRDLSDGSSFTGDVPYHLGYASEIAAGDAKVSVTLLPHPSHLIVVAPVALGLARAMSRQDEAGSSNALCVLLHTDAAFAGQGLSAEIMQIGGLAGYSCGGTIHLVVNNQIGFTTLPSEGRSAHYCTDIGKAVGVPVLHVNGDDPLAVARIARLAVAWRSRFGKDVIIDLVCYRRYGHNELDEPRFTQPTTWSLVDAHPGVRETFTASVRESRPDVAERAKAAARGFRDRLQQGFDAAKGVTPNGEPFQGKGWAGLSLAGADDLLDPVATGVEEERLRAIGLAGARIPEEFGAHPKVRQFYEARAASIASGKGINFATAEALAFGSLLAEGRKVRLSGQDAVRGTFTQRHLAVHDGDGRTFVPLAAATRRPAGLEVINSPLSEYGVLGFEYGHSLHDPDQLTIWEAQFGDFLNGAQVVVDQYIVSAEAKWRLKSGLVVLLPHGLEGQGPDHSSARIERLVQLCAEGNIVVAQPSTPANLFHLLRRQLVAPWRKPLFVAAPKSLLRARVAVSSLSEMGAGTAFRPVLVDAPRQPEHVRRIVLCSGKIFYELERERRASTLADAVVPVRVEQIYPFPAAELARLAALCPEAEWTWLQEEPVNQGAWAYVREELPKRGVRFSETLPVVARPAMAAAAAGSVERHEREQKALLERVLDLRR